MTASTLPVASNTTAVTATNRGIFIVASLLRVPQHPRVHYRSSNEPEMNGPFARGSFRWARLFQDAAARFRLQQRDRPLFGAAKGGTREAAMASLQHPERMRTRAGPSCYGGPKSCTEAPRSPRSSFAAAKGRRLRRGCGRRSRRSRRAIRPSGGAPGAHDRRWAPGPRPRTLLRPLERGRLARASNVRLPLR
jgi:hypothetical protein